MDARTCCCAVQRTGWSSSRAATPWPPSLTQACHMKLQRLSPVAISTETACTTLSCERLAKCACGSSPVHRRIYSCAATDGFGVSAEFAYGPLTDTTVHKIGNGAAYPEQDIQPADSVLIRLAITDGIGKGRLASSSFHYEGFRRNVQGRGSLGFRKLTRKETLGRASADHGNHSPPGLSLRRTDGIHGRPSGKRQARVFDRPPMVQAGYRHAPEHAPAPVRVNNDEPPL